MDDKLRELLVLWTVGTLYREYEGKPEQEGYEFFCSERVSRKLLHYATDDFCEPLVDDDIRNEARERIAEEVKDYIERHGPTPANCEKCGQQVKKPGTDDGDGG